MKKILMVLALTILSCKLFSQSDKKITYYDNGNKKELLHYYDGKLDGTCIAWNDSGIVIGKVHYKNGLRTDRWFIWHNNGRPAYKFYYDKNEKVGVWKYYDESGFHLLRHSSFTSMLENGTDLRIIQSIAGHKSSKTTEIYTHVSTNCIKQAAMPI